MKITIAAVTNSSSMSFIMRASANKTAISMINYLIFHSDEDEDNSEKEAMVKHLENNHYSNILIPFTCNYETWISSDWLSDITGSALVFTCDNHGGWRDLPYEYDYILETDEYARKGALLDFEFYDVEQEKKIKMIDYKIEERKSWIIAKDKTREEVEKQIRQAYS